MILMYQARACPRFSKRVLTGKILPVTGHQKISTCPRSWSSWKTLGLTQDCTKDDAKSAYRRLMLDVHPDLHNGDEMKTKQAILVNEAYLDVMTQLSKREASIDVSPFDDCEYEEPMFLFVNPLLCRGVPHIYWYDLQLLAQEAGETGFQSRMVSEGFRIPDQAFVYLTESQYKQLMRELERIQVEFDRTAVEVLEYHLLDCLSRAQEGNK